MSNKVENRNWSLLNAYNFRKFMKQIQSPLGMGTVFLEDETSVYGFLCESDYLKNTKEISDIKSWRNFLCH